MTKLGIDFGEYNRAYSVDTINALAAQNSHCMVMNDGGAGSSSDLLQENNQSSSRSYRLHLVFVLPQLTCLDGICITAEEKVDSFDLTIRSRP